MSTEDLREAIKDKPRGKTGVRPSTTDLPVGIDEKATKARQARLLEELQVIGLSDTEASRLMQGHFAASSIDEAAHLATRVKPTRLDWVYRPRAGNVDEWRAGAYRMTFNMKERTWEIRKSNKLIGTKKGRPAAENLAKKDAKLKANPKDTKRVKAAAKEIRAVLKRAKKGEGRRGFERVEIGIYRKGRVPVARYAGWNAWLKVNDESVWEFRRLDLNQRGIVYDHVLDLEAPLEERGSDDKRAFFMVVPALAEHAELISGQWPALATGQVSGEMLSVEAALPAEAAEEFGLAPGDTFVVDPFWDDDNDQMTVRIAGVYGWRDQDGVFWSKLDDALYLTDDSLRFAPLTVSEETFTGAIGPYYPKMDGDRAWWMESDVHRLRASDGEAVIAAFDAVRADLTRSVDGYDHRTAIPGALERIQLRLVYNRMPMTIVVFLLVGVVLYYVATLSSLLVGVQRGSIALLRSRSASYHQIVSAYTVQALALAAVAIVIGPFVAAAGVRLIGAMPMFHALNAGALLPARATGEAYLVALTGGALGFLALVVPAARTARFGLLQEQRASTRPPRLPAFQRYYLDLVFLGGVLLAM